MKYAPNIMPSLLQAINDVIEKNSAAVTALDQAIGDGDHVINLQRGIHALMEQSGEFDQLDWVAAWQKIGMTLMTSVGGASGSLYGTMFIAMSKEAGEQSLNLQTFAGVFNQSVEAVKRRGKSDVGEKTMLDVLAPVAESLLQASVNSVEMPELLATITNAAITGMESTRDMLATKGRASYLGERTRGHIDAGAKTAQLMICAITGVLAENL